MKPTGFIRLIVSIVMLIGSLTLAARHVVAAPANEALTEGGGICLPLAGCGDGVCDPYFGENATTCPADCAAPPPPPPAPSPTPTARPTATRVPQVVRVTPTGSQTAVGGAGTGPTPTPTATSTPLPTATPRAAVCELAAFDTLPDDWQGGYLELSGQSDFTAEQASTLLVAFCPTTPTGQLCLPLSQTLLNTVDEDTNQIRLVECTDEGSCRTLRGTGQQVGDELCYDLGANSTFTCETGCTLLPQQAFLLRFPEIDLGNLPTEIVAPVAAIGLILVLAGAMMIIFVVRRSRNREV